MKNIGANMCVDSTGPTDPAGVKPCSVKNPSQNWTLLNNGHIQNSNSNCLDVYDFSGPDVQIYPCKVPGQGDNNQIWIFKNGQLHTAADQNMCLSVGASNPGSMLSTFDSSGTQRCLYNYLGSEGGWTGLPCTQTNFKPTLFFLTPKGNSPNMGVGNYIISSPSGSPTWNNQVGASGPWPHSRYIYGYGWDTSSPAYELDLDAAKSGKGTTIVASDHSGIIDDNLLGKISYGGNFCLDLVTGGLLEVWAAPLSNGRLSVALFNRSPSSDKISLKWSDVGISGSHSVYDIWEAMNKGVFQDVYTATVSAHATAFLILSPQNQK